MHFECGCGATYLVVPKEIPLSEDEVIVCECGRLIRAKRSTRYFDYEKDRVELGLTVKK